MRKLLITLMCLMPLAAEAEVLVRSLKPLEIDIQTTDAPLSVFSRFEDLWIVSNQPDADLSLKFEPGITLETMEELQVRGGRGVRLTLPQAIDIQINKADNAIQIRAASNGQSIRGIPLQLDTNNDQAKILVPKGDMVRAISLNTRESYLVMPVASAAGVEETYSEGPIRFLKSAMGLVLVSDDGLPLGFINGDEGVKITPMQDQLSKAVARQNTADVSSFVDQVFSAPQPQQVPTAPSPRRAITDYRISLPGPSDDPDGTYEDALGTLRGALDEIARINDAPRSRAPSARTHDDILAQIPSLGSIGEGKAPLPPALQAAIDELSQGNFQKSTLPRALPENQFLPNFGNRSRRELAQLEARMRMRWLAAKTADDKDAALLRLGGLKVFMQQYPEALGIVRNMRQNPETKLPGREEGALLVAVAQTMMGRHQEALETLTRIAMPSRDKALWIAATETAAGRYDNAQSLFDEHISQANQYPRTVNQELRYRYAQALFQNGQLTRALNEVDQVAALGGDGRILPFAQLLMARIYERQGQDEVAEQIYVNLAEHRDQLVSSHALFHFLAMLTDRGELSPEAAAIRFENLRFLWRGDEVERESLWKLGELYTDLGQLRNALDRYKYLNVYFSDTERAQQAAEKMTDVFARIFLQDNIDLTTDDLGLIGLYYEYRELTPPGRVGDQLVASVVARLADLGLVRRAIDMLEQQLRYRIKNPISRAEAGLQLAELYHREFDTDAGFEALAETATNGLPQELAELRRVMRAKLLDQRTQREQAKKLIANATGPEAADLKADLAWEEQNYAEVSKNMAAKFQAAGGADWTQTQASEFMRYMVALSRTGQPDMMRDLADRYNDGLVKHNMRPYSEYLIALASPPKADTRGTDENPALLGGVWGQSIEAIDANKKFAQRYRQQRATWMIENEQARQSEFRARNPGFR